MRKRQTDRDLQRQTNRQTCRQTETEIPTDTIKDGKWSSSQVYKYRRKEPTDRTRDTDSRTNGVRKWFSYCEREGGERQTDRQTDT